MHKTWVVLLLLVAAMAIRVVGLDRLPPGLWSDEANHGLEVEAIMEGGPRPVFFPGNCGQEPIYKYLVVLATAVRGTGAATLRLPSAVSGSLLVLLTWCWVRRVRGREEAGWAMLLVAFGVWHLHFSRIAFRANLGPTAGLAALLLTDSYLRHPRPWRGVLAGLSAALLWYTYPAFRLFPLLPALWLVMHLPRHDRIGRWAAPAAAFSIGLVPLMWAWAHVPELITARSAMASLWSETPDPVAGFFRNLVLHAGMFTVAGDRNPRHNLSGEPLLDPLTGFFFVIGLGIALARRDRADRLLLVWLVVQLMPGVLSVERQAPHGLRTLGVLPVPYLLAASGLMYLRQAIGSRWAPAFSLAVALAIPSINLARYFVVWPASLDRLNQAEEALFGFHRPEDAVGRWLAGAPPDREIYLSPQLYLHWTTAYMAGGAPYRVTNDDMSPDPGDVIALQLHRRNAWWMRDDFRKNFFRVWTETGRVSAGEIWRAIAWAYPQCPCMTALSDSLLLERLSRRFVLREIAPLEGVSRFEVAATRPGGDAEAWASDSWRRLPPGCFTVTVDSPPQGVGTVVLAAREEESDRVWTLERHAVTPGEPVILHGCLLFPSCARIETGNGDALTGGTWRYAGPADTEPYLRRTPWGAARRMYARLRLRMGT